MSRPELAHAMDVHPNVLANIEGAVTKQPEMQTVVELGRVLELDFNEVMEFFGAPRLKGIKSLASTIERRPKLGELLEAARRLDDVPLAYLVSIAMTFSTIRAPEQT